MLKLADTALLAASLLSLACGRIDTGTTDQDDVSVGASGDDSTPATTNGGSTTEASASGTQTGGDNSTAATDEGTSTGGPVDPALLGPCEDACTVFASCGQDFDGCMEECTHPANAPTKACIDAHLEYLACVIKETCDSLDDCGCCEQIEVKESICN
ncbi:MAG: hypothetical protein KC486_02930 [Myxococcales bacterium]|nr:hypothetical protein [Myxococcales bacterium]